MDDFDEEIDAFIEGEMDAEYGLPYSGDADARDDLTDAQKEAYEDNYLAGYDGADDDEC